MENFVLFTYSSVSLNKVKELLQEMINTFGLTVSVDDLFYYGVFCAVSQYVGTPELNKEISCIPAILTSEYTPYCEKEDYVKSVINSVIKGEISKPDWMIEIEQSDRCGRYSPSTYLMLVPKNEIYENLGNKLIEFLYSTGIEVENRKELYN